MRSKVEIIRDMFLVEMAYNNYKVNNPKFNYRIKHHKFKVMSLLRKELEALSEVKDE